MLQLLLALAFLEPPIQGDDLVLRLSADGAIRTYGATLVAPEKSDDLSPVFKLLEERLAAEKGARIVEYQVFLRVEADVPWGRVWELMKGARERGGVYRIHVSCAAADLGMPLWFPKDVGVGPTPAPRPPCGPLAVSDAGAVQFAGKDLGTLDGRNDRQVLDALARALKESREGVKDPRAPSLELGPKLRMHSALALLDAMRSVGEFETPGGKYTNRLTMPVTSSGWPPDVEASDLEVSLRKDGTLTLGGKPASLDAIEQVLKDRLKQDSYREGDEKSGWTANYRVFVNAEPESSWAVLVKLLEAAKRGGVTRVALSPGSNRESGQNLFLNPDSSAAPQPIGEIRLVVRDGRLKIDDGVAGAMGGVRELQQSAERVRDRAAELSVKPGWIRLTLEAGDGETVGSIFPLLTALWREGVRGFSTPGKLDVDLGDGWTKEE